MTDIQLPLNPTTTNHQQKGGVINSGKLIAKASNLEIRGGSLISNSHNANNPNHATNNNELTGGVVSSSQHHSHANRSTIMSSSKRQQTGQHQTTSSSGQGTLVSLNIIDFKQVGVVAAPRRREHVRNTTLSRQQQQQSNRYPLSNSNTSSAKKPIPIELTLSTSRLMLNDENNHPTAVNTNQKNVDSLVENIWWPNDDQESVLNAMATNNAANNPSNPHKHHHHHHHVVDNCCNSLSTTSAAWTASTTGVMSDRSSVYSIDDGGDFDREASHKVNKQLKEIEAILYEQVSQLNHHHYHNNNNLNEYKEWSHKFPHLRILGSGLLKDENNQDTTSRSSILNNLNSSSIQIIPANQLNNNNLSTSTNLSKNNNASKELGEQLSELPSSTTTTNKFTRRRENTDLNNQGIYLNGQSISVRKLDANGPPLSNEHRHLEEEIFEQEGTYEELLAYDNQEEEYLVEHNKRLNLTKRRRHGLPPITPKASMRDLVNNFLFDFMWSSLIDWSLALIKEYSKSIVDAQMTMDSLTRANTDISSTSDQQQQQHTPKAVNHQPATTKPAEQNQGGLFNNTANNPVGSSKTASANNQILNPIQIQALKTTPNGGLHAPLKPFDPPLNQSAYFTNSEKPMQPQQSFTPASMSRDNSTLFNSQLSRYNTIINSGEHMHEGKLVDEAIAKYLQIKQLNTFGNSASKNLVPISSGSRVGSGKLQSQVQQQQQQQQQQIRGGPQHYQLGKKRFSSIEVVSSSNQQQQQQQPTSTSALGLTTTTSLSSSASQNSNQMSVHGNALGHKSEQPHSGGSHHHHNANRSGNNSTMMHHHHHDGSDHDLVAAESSLLDAAGGVVAGNEIMSIDEINLINGAGGGHSTSMIKQPAQASSPHVHFYQQPMVQNQPNSVHFLHQLPPIGKPTRISSASNVNTNKERSERPLTSTAIRIDSMNFPLHKRSTTPLGLASSNKVQNYYQSMKRRFNVSLDDPFHINNNTNISANTMSIVNSFSNFLSTKSFNNMSGAQNQQSNNTAATNTLNRRNSIKESQRSHK